MEPGKHELIELKGELHTDKFRGAGKSAFKESVSLSSIEGLYSQLKSISDFWNKDAYMQKALVQVEYKDIVPKSKRLTAILGVNDSDKYIVGAKFKRAGDKFVHAMTYYIGKDVLNKAVDLLGREISLIKTAGFSMIGPSECKKISDQLSKSGGDIGKTRFSNTVFDSSNISCFRLPYLERKEIKAKNIMVTVFKTEHGVKELVKSASPMAKGIEELNDTTAVINSSDFQRLANKYPFIVAMAVQDISEIRPEDSHINIARGMSIPDPDGEPVIGVFDTMFDKEVYFGKWVREEKMLPDGIPIKYPKDFRHGTEVDSILVDGPSLNTDLQDDCGHFRVMHFEVCTDDKMNGASLIDYIKQAVAEHPEIHVWNLSLGSILEIDQNFISPVAAALDEIQKEYNVIFVVAGTNKNRNEEERQWIGSPADSINSVVVNAIDKKGDIASYSRHGPVLSFYAKPDVSCFGGDGRVLMTVCPGGGSDTATTCGTSFAAPWIARKLCFMIDILHLSREVAKALLIDSCASWDEPRKDLSQMKYLGYGIVPQRIEDVVYGNKDELKFIIKGETDAYKTYTYRIPIPEIFKDSNPDKKYFPYKARGTLCYFSNCDRDQGVEYTLDEMNLRVGRMWKKKDGKEGEMAIKTINDDHQVEDDEGTYTNEQQARRYFRKWDPVKQIGETIKRNPKDIESFNSFWGIELLNSSRPNGSERDELKFGLVVRLKEIHEVDRFNDFEQMLIAQGWIVNNIDIDNYININVQSNEEVKLD